MTNPITTPTLVAGNGFNQFVTAINTGSDHSHFQVGTNTYGTGYANYGETLRGVSETTNGPLISPLSGIANNTKMVAGAYDGTWTLSVNGKTVYGVGYNGGYQFGVANATDSIAAAVPWAFVPNPLFVPAP